MDNSAVVIPPACEVSAKPEQCQGCEGHTSDVGPLKPFLAETFTAGWIQAWWCQECGEMADSDWCDFLSVFLIS